MRQGPFVLTPKKDRLAMSFTAEGPPPVIVPPSPWMKTIDARGWTALSADPALVIYIKRLAPAANGDARILKRTEAKNPNTADRVHDGSAPPYLSSVATFEYDCAKMVRRLTAITYYPLRNLSGVGREGEADTFWSPPGAGPASDDVAQAFACASH